MQFKKIVKVACLASAMALLANGSVFADQIENATTMQAQETAKRIYKQNGMRVETPWSRATPKSAEVAGGYIHIFNDRDDDDAFVGVTSPVCDNIELHEMSIKDGVMKMRKAPGPIVIHAHTDLQLKPGGYHIMFMKLKKPFVLGETFPATLHFQKSGDMNVVFKVEPMGALKPSE